MIIIFMIVIIHARQIAEQLFCDRFTGILGANSSQFTVFVANYIKSKIFIGLELLISYRNTVTASMKNISVMNDGEDDDEPFRPFPIERHFIVCKLKCSFIINRGDPTRSRRGDPTRAPIIIRLLSMLLKLLLPFDCGAATSTSAPSLTSRTSWETARS